MLLSTTRTKAAAAIVVLAGGVAVATTATAGGPKAATLSVLESGAPATLSAATAAHLGASEVDATKARWVDAKVTATTGATASSLKIAIAPSDQGACLVNGDSVSCGTNAQIRGGALFTVVNPTITGVPKQLPPAVVEALHKSGGNMSLPASSVPAKITGGTILGLVTDGYSSVQLLSAAGKVLATAPVQSNVYAVDGVAPSDVATIKVTGPSGTNSTSLLETK